MAQREHSIDDIAAATGGERSAMSRQAKKEAWPFRVEPGSAKRRLYVYASLPKAMREALDKQVFDQAFSEARQATSTAVIAKPASAPSPRADGAIVIGGLVRKARDHKDLTDIDRARQEGALILCRAIDEAISQMDCSAKKAMTGMATRILNRSDSQELVAAAAITYVKPRKNGQTVDSLVSRLQKMYAAYLAGQKEGDVARYLVPGQRESEGFDPLDIRAFLLHFCKPSRPEVIQAWRDAAPWYAENGLHYPAKDTFYRIERALPVTVKCRGRMTGAAYTALLPYVSRDVSMFHANDIWVGDGHTFKARIKNPVTGKAFRPEVTLIIDWVSRKIVGWSVDLAESTIAVSAALRDAQLKTRSRPLIYYSDNGSGQKGKKIDHPITGTAARQGFAHETGIPGHPQGRGIIERVWPSILIPLAKQYPTCLTKDMDRDTIRRVTGALAKSERAGEESALLPTFEQFIADLTAAIDRYNAEHAHSELGGMTPNQAYDARLDPESIIAGVTNEEIHTMWMPEVIRTPQRGLIELFNNEYFMGELPDILAEGEKVRVRYDIHDAGSVLLLRMDGREIGRAEWEGNKVAAFPVPEVEQKRHERARGIKKKAQREIDRADAELGNAIEGDYHQEVPVMEIPSGNVVQIAPGASAPPGERQNSEQRLAAMGDYSRLAWLAEHPEDWTPEYRRYLAMKVQQGSRVIEEALEDFGLWGEIENFAPQGDSDHQRAEARDESYKVAAVSGN